VVKRSVHIVRLLLDLWIYVLSILLLILAKVFQDSVLSRANTTIDYVRNLSLTLLPIIYNNSKAYKTVLA
jgi:hypothetical protein